MQGHKHFSDKAITQFPLSEHVLRHNLYCRLSALLDWDFLYQQTRAVYSHTGQPSLDPVVFFKLVLVGRLENLVSDRRLVEHCALRLDILYLRGSNQMRQKRALTSFCHEFKTNQQFAAPAPPLRLDLPSGSVAPG